MTGVQTCALPTCFPVTISSMVSVSTRTDRSHRFLFVTLKVEFTKIDLGYLDGEEAEMLADEFQAISNEIRDFANWIKKQG